MKRVRRPKKAIKIEVSLSINFFTTKMSITLSHQMFASLSKSCQNEILEAFSTTSLAVVKKMLSMNENTAFESASLTYGKPLVLPNYNMTNEVMSEPLVEPLVEPLAEPLVEPLAEPMPEPMSEPMPENKVVRIASNFPIAKSTDLYSTAHYSVIGKICHEIDAGLFVSNCKSVDWSKGSRYHHMNWDVKRVVMIVNQLKPATSLEVDQALPTMDRHRVTAILRELRKQGILIVN